MKIFWNEIPEVYQFVAADRHSAEKVVPAAYALRPRPSARLLEEWSHHPDDTRELFIMVEDVHYQVEPEDGFAVIETLCFERPIPVKARIENEVELESALYRARLDSVVNALLSNPAIVSFDIWADISRANIVARTLVVAKDVLKDIDAEVAFREELARARKSNEP